MITPRLAVHRSLRWMGLHLQRWRDPYQTAVRLLENRPVQHVIDGGAYRGSVSRRLVELFPQARVHAFEPQSSTFAELKRRLTDQPRVTPYQLALSDRAGTSVLHINRQAFTTSLLPSAEPAAMQPIGQETIRTATLDDWAQEHGVEGVGLLKLDLQGHELAALRGAARLLRKTWVVLAEVNFQRRYHGSCLFHEVAQFIHDHGFALHGLTELITERDGRWRQADALFTRTESALLGSMPLPEVG